MYILLGTWTLRVRCALNSVNSSSEGAVDGAEHAGGRSRAGRHVS